MNNKITIEIETDIVMGELQAAVIRDFLEKEFSTDKVQIKDIVLVIPS